MGMDCIQIFRLFVLRSPCHSRLIPVTATPSTYQPARSTNQGVPDLRFFDSNFDSSSSRLWRSAARTSERERSPEVLS